MYRAPVLLVGVKTPEENGRRAGLSIRPLPMYGLGYHHRIVALCALTTLFFDMLHHQSDAIRLHHDAAGMQPFWQPFLLAVPLLVLAAALFWHACAAPIWLSRMIWILHAVFAERPWPRLNLLLRRVRRRGMRWAVVPVVATYLAGFALLRAAAALLGVHVDRASALLFLAIFFGALIVPPYLLFTRRRFAASAPRHFLTGVRRGGPPVGEEQAEADRRRMQRLRPALHMTLEGEFQYKRRMIRHIVAPFRNTHAALSLEPSSDPEQMAIAKIFVRRILTGRPVDRIFAIGYALAGGWLLLVLAAALQSALPASLVCGAMVMAGAVAVYLARLDSELEKFGEPTAREAEALPSWMFAREDRGRRNMLRARREIYKYLGTGVSLLLVGFVAALETADFTNPQGLRTLRTDPGCAFSPRAVFGVRPGPADDALRDLCEDHPQPNGRSRRQ